MSTTTTTTARPVRTTTLIPSRFVDLLHSEWLKMWSLPAMWLSVIGLFIVGFGAAAFMSVTLESSIPPSEFLADGSLYDLVMGIGTIGQIVAGIVGVMCIGSEYASGTIQPTLLAAPTRVRSLAAKAVVLFGTLTAVSLITVFAAWAFSLPFYSPWGLALSLDMPGVVGAFVGVSVYMGLCGVFGLGVGTVVRSTALGSIIVFVVTLLGPVLSMYLPRGPITTIVRTLFIGYGGDGMMRLPIDGAPVIDFATGHLSPLGGFIIVGGWAAIAFIVGAVLLRKRDA